ncbi:PREDICTED: phospholipase B1, membrane-associated-like [Nicrophorus vespilloides]|uniref:Phospholipase B1, membrane-associated-like n=1 Tax=Nicrophorus vespilloides TaxID=110193 RepID=A0ABM1MFN2_NICVS|nr:PREDICTED: phospholipase B1, membrane-associated-like [Nicrophorus vespilloides]
MSGAKGVVCLMILVVLSRVAKDVRGQSGSLFAQTYRDLFLRAQRMTGNLVIQYPPMEADDRKQKNYPKSVPFMCANQTAEGRSKVRPTSVHRLRPGDIDVIGAIGDSLIAGNGAMEDWALGTMIEYRGISWCAGGQESWRTYLTVPNIIKEFNPKLTGYSTGTGELLSAHSRFNVAFPVSADADALRQAKILVKRMKQDRSVDFKNDWKMVTVFFGANDLCSAQCFDREQASPPQHARKLMLALDYFRDNLPRTFVNLIPVIDATVSVRVKRSMMCRLVHTLFCTCFHQGGTEDPMTIIMQLARKYQKVEEQLALDGRYEKKEDFAVVLQPFMKLFNAQTDPAHRYDEVIDISYITHDCFHFSQKGHALGANMLWNNMLEPVGNKSEKRLNYVLEKFKCPTQEAPFLFTRKNSEMYLRTGRQWY